MELKTVFERYHASDAESSPVEVSRATLITDKAVDARFGEPLTIKRSRITNGGAIRRGLALAALVLALATLAAILWPDNFKAAVNRYRRSQIIGVPETSAATVAQNAPAAVPTPTVASANQTLPPAAPPPVEARDDLTANATSLDQQQPAVAQDANAGADVASAETSSRTPSNEKLGDSPANATAIVSAKPKTVTSTATLHPSVPRSRPRIAQTLPENSQALPPLRPGSFRAQVLGTTPHGNLILGLPSGRTVIVAPPMAEFVPRYRIRYIPIERRPVFLPRPSFAPLFPPGD